MLIAELLAAAAIAAAPPFEAKVSPVRWDEIRYTWRRGCPVPPRGLRTVRLTYWGFDDRPHTGLIVVHRRVAGDVVRVFRRAYGSRFAIRRMVSVTRYRGSDDASMAADNTSGFNCRRVYPGGPWSMHAYGLAIDVNPVENPYVKGGSVSPPAGRPFVDRSPARKGMIVEGGVLVRAFDSVGWKWGGRWRSSLDYQHFSTNGQ